MKVNCHACRRTLKHHARVLCSKCYKRIRHADGIEGLSRFERVKPEYYHSQDPQCVYVHKDGQRCEHLRVVMRNGYFGSRYCRMHEARKCKMQPMDPPKGKSGFHKHPLEW